MLRLAAGPSHRGAPVNSTLGLMTSLRQRLVDVALEWERVFGTAPQVTSALSEFDAAQLVGMTEAEYSNAMQGSTAVQRGLDFRFRGLRYQVKATRPSGKPGSRITKVPSATNYDWDVLIWVCYDIKYVIQEAWAWSVSDYRAAFEHVARLSPEHMRRGRSLLHRNEA